MGVLFKEMVAQCISKQSDVDGGGKSDKMESDGDVVGVLPNADKAVISMEKLVNYVLNTEHPIGKHKAYLFKEVLGYSVGTARNLAVKIMDEIYNFPAIFKGSDRFGNKYEIIMNIEGINGRTAPVITAWIIDSGSDVPRLTSAYIHKKR